MSRLRTAGLTIDDPLAASRAAPAASTARRGRTSPTTQNTTSAPANGARRAWSGATRVASYRLPDELLAELASTAGELQLPVGLLVTAAIARLLDEPDDAIEGLVDRADDARIQGRRASRRAARVCSADEETSSDRPGTL